MINPSQSPRSSHRTRLGKECSESSGDYRHIVLMISSKWRIIECRQGLQWIIQKCQGIRYGTTRWESKKYLLSREGLVKACQRLNLNLETNSVVALKKLPKYIQKKL